MDAGDRRCDLPHGGFRIRQVGAENEGDLRLGLGLDRPLRIKATAVGDAHVVEQSAEVGLIDAKLDLHRLRRQPCLATDDPPSLGLPEPGVDRLHRIGARCIGRVQHLAQGGDHGPRIGIAQPARGGFIGR
ncbi:hypothetical protein D3C85_1389940 [compost metagenome]